MNQDTPPRDIPSQESPPTASRLPLIAIGALIALAILVALALGLSGAKEFDEGTPQAALQDYLDAAIDEDADAILELLTTEGRLSCSDRLADQLWAPNGIGFRLNDMDIDGSTATAVVDERYSNSNDPFSGGGSAGDEQFELLEVAAGDWRITKASWPWPVKNCLEGRS